MKKITCILLVLILNMTCLFSVVQADSIAETFTIGNYIYMIDSFGPTETPIFKLTIVDKVDPSIDERPITSMTTDELFDACGYTEPMGELSWRLFDADNLTIHLNVTVKLKDSSNWIADSNGFYEINFSDQQPIIINGRTLVPLRAIFEALGTTVEWNGETQTVTAQKSGTNISLTIGSNEMLVNGEVKVLDVTAQLINDRTMVPVRAISEAFGATVSWDNDFHTVFIEP